MIHLTRLNSAPITINSDLIKTVEQAPDTVITLTTGEKIIVRETAIEIVAYVIEFRRAVNAGSQSVLPNGGHCLPHSQKLQDDQN